jgi:hypothetical protein
MGAMHGFAVVSQSLLRESFRIRPQAMAQWVRAFVAVRYARLVYVCELISDTFDQNCGSKKIYRFASAGLTPARSPRSLYGSPAPVKVVRKNGLALRAGGSVCGSTVDSARRAKGEAG